MPRRITLLSELAAEHFESLKEKGTPRNYPANAMLVHEGVDSNPALFALFVVNRSPRMIYCAR